MKRHFYRLAKQLNTEILYYKVYRSESLFDVPVWIYLIQFRKGNQTGAFNRSYAIDEAPGKVEISKAFRDYVESLA